MGRKAYTKSQKVQKYLEHNAGAKAPEVAKATGVDISYVYNIVSSSRKLKVGDSATEPKKRGRPTKLFKELMAVARGEQKPRLRMQTAPTEAQATQNLSGVIQGATGAQYTFMDTSPKPTDMVNSPSHYKVGGIETIDFIEAKNLNYNLGNAVKYISRADHKGEPTQDLEKAIFYLKREIENRKKT
jgi:transposase